MHTYFTSKKERWNVALYDFVKVGGRFCSACQGEGKNVDNYEEP